MKQRVWQLTVAYRQSNRRAIALSAAFVPLIRMLILAGLPALLYGGMAAVAGRMSVGTLQCVSVPDPSCSGL